MLVLAALIALVWGVLQLTGGGDEPKASPTKETPKPVPTQAATTTPTAPEPKVNGLVDVALVRAAKPCDPVQVRITPTVRPGQLNAGPVDVGLVISSTAEQACTLTPEDADAIAVISANGTAIWDSTVCKTSLLNAPVAISPGWATLAAVQWTGRGSGGQCAGNEGFATPGKYTLQIGTLGGEPGKTTFTLDARPAPPKPKPTPKRKAKATPAPTETPKTPNASDPPPAAG